MFGGTVTFRAGIKGNGLKFPLFDFNPNETGVDKIELESPNGNEIKTTVHLASVATREDAVAIAAKLNTEVLNRISFFRGIAIGNGQITRSQFTPLNPQPGAHLTADIGSYLLIGGEVSLVVSTPAARLKAELEQASPPGEQYFGLLRSARQSGSPVEEFMHLYHVLLMLFNDC